MKPAHYLITLPLILILLIIMLFPLMGSFAKFNSNSLFILLLLIPGIIRESRITIIITAIFLTFISIVSIMLMIQIRQHQIGFTILASLSFTGLFLLIFKQAILKMFAKG